jgi:hypothetical protein
MQAVRITLALAELEPSGHVVHVALPDVVLYFPGSHAVHAPLSGPVKPGLHVHAELAAGEVELVGHVRQVAAAVAALAVEYFAAAQSVHTAAPVAVLYFPATHAVHVPPSGPVKPRLQRHAVRATLGLGELEPEGHVLHVADPVVSLYVPGSHAVHATPSAPVNPALHVHAALAELATGELELVTHPMQVAAAVAALVVEYFAATQSVHTAAPVAVLYFPATHAVHVPPFGPVKPRLQRHAVRAVLVTGELELSGHVKHVLAPAVEYVPAPQFIHEAVPVSPLYFPAVHVVHVPPLAPDEPALQVQEVSAVLETGEYELEGHATHALATVAPAVTEYVPAVQFVHTVAPVVAEYVPVIQFVHTLATVAPVTAEYLPEPQSVHTEFPVVVVYFPATHALHVPPLGPL